MKIKLKRIANVKSFINIFSGKDKTQQQHTKYFGQRSGKGTKKAAEKDSEHQNRKGNKSIATVTGEGGLVGGKKGGKKLAVSINEPYKQDFRCFCFVLVVFTPSRRTAAKSIRLIRFRYFCFCSVFS